LTPEVWPRRADVYLIGITGNIAVGKSTVDAMLAAKGAAILDADVVTRELQRRGHPVWQAIVDRFGQEVLASDGELDRARLGQIVFSDPAALRNLELIVHPAVRQKERRRVLDAPAGSVLVIDAVQLIESGMADSCNSVWAVVASAEQQLERLQRQRAMPSEIANQRITAQPEQDDKVRRADVVIRNHGTLEDTQRQVDDAWARTAGAWLAAQTPRG